MSYETYYGHLLVWRFQHVPVFFRSWRHLRMQAKRIRCFFCCRTHHTRDCKVTLDGSSHSFEGENLDRWYTVRFPILRPTQVGIQHRCRFLEDISAQSQTVVLQLSAAFKLCLCSIAICIATIHQDTRERFHRQCEYWTGALGSIVCVWTDGLWCMQDKCRHKCDHTSQVLCHKTSMLHNGRQTETRTKGQHFTKWLHLETEQSRPVAGLNQDLQLRGQQADLVSFNTALDACAEALFCDIQPWTMSGSLFKIPGGWWF